MEADLEAPLAGELAGPRHTFRQTPPAAFVQSQCAVGDGTARVLQALRRAVVGEDRVGLASVRRREEIQGPRHAGEILLVVIWLAQPHGDEAAGEREAGACEPLAELAAGSQVARRPELRGLVAGL